MFSPNTVVFWEGDVESNLFFLQYGSLKVLKASPDGSKQVLRFIQAGEIFNEVGIFAKKANLATALALEESGIWLIPRHALEELVLVPPHVAMQFIENMADKILKLVTFTADLSLKTVEARFAKLLLEQVSYYFLPPLKLRHKLRCASRRRKKLSFAGWRYLYFSLALLL
jgi:CRP-like cAMP-binding protein